MGVIKKVFRFIGYSMEAIKYIVLYPIAMIAYGQRNIYIVAERGTDARDNGYYMFRFLCQKHPELEVYYIISKSSADREKLLDLGNVVHHGSLKHYLLFIAAQYKISTHIMGFSPNIGFYSKFADKLHVKGYRVFLQHGIIPNDLPGLYAEKTNLQLFVCGAKPEYDYVRSTFGYQNGEVKYTGLARYDGLHDLELKNQILCMPTWRSYLKFGSKVGVAESEYVKRWNRLINHPRIISALKERNVKLVFYPHYEMQPYISSFQAQSEQVIIADFDHYDVQTLLKESRLLITDYSSVFFDFAYMKKPCVYYQFDQEKFFKWHYQKGYFDYELAGFGEVVKGEEDAVDAILSYIENHFAMKSEYRVRTESFFPLHDMQNCQRIYEEIQKLSFKFQR